jgi:hypothetical protein
MSLLSIGDLRSTNITIHTMKPVLPRLAVVDISAMIYPSILDLSAKSSTKTAPKNTVEESI